MHDMEKKGFLGPEIYKPAARFILPLRRRTYMKEFFNTSII